MSGSLYSALTAESAAAALAQLDIRITSEDLAPERRDGRWMVRLPGDRLAWFASTPAGLRALTTERRVLRALGTCCDIVVPRVLVESADGAVDVRVAVPGVHEPDAVYQRVRSDSAAAARLGAALGEIVAELHTCVDASESGDALPDHPSWPEPRDRIRERLPLVVDDPMLHAKADALIARYEEMVASTPDVDRALVHSDLGLHNISIDPATLEVRGVFDWESACLADRHLDFRYFTFGPGHDALLAAALRTYHATTGCRLSRARIDLYNAASAIGYLAFRAGVPPERAWCGRTLTEDLAWTRWAIARVEAATR